MPEVYSNAGLTTLAGSIGNSDTTLTVSNPSKFPISGNFRILIDSELLLVTGVNGSVFTILRGIEGTSPNSHTNGVTISQVLTKGSLDAIRSDDHLFDFLVNKPAAQTVGRLFFPKDAYLLERDNGTVWDGFLPFIIPVNKVTPLLGFTFFQQNLATVNYNKSALYYFSPKAQNSGSGLIKSQLTPPYTLIVGFLPLFNPNDFVFIGPGFRESSSGKIISFGFLASGSNRQVVVANWSSPFSYTNNAFAQFLSTLPNPILFFKLNHDNINLNFSWSIDGQNYLNIFSQPKNLFFTSGPDQVGFFIYNTLANGYDASATVYHWSEF